MDTGTTTLTRSPYEVLGLTRWATTEEIKSRYFELTKKYNPEYFPDEFIEVRTAYEIMKDPNSRASTDVSLFTPAPSFYFSDYPNFPEQTLSLFKLNQELKAICGDREIQSLSTEDKQKAIHCLRGIGLYQMAHDQVEDALRTWQEVLRLNPDDIETEQNLYYARWQEAYKKALDEQYAEAEAQFAKMIEEGVEHGAIYHNLALCQEKQGKKEEALESFNKELSFYKNELKKDPDNSYYKAIVLALHKYTGGKFLKHIQGENSDMSAAGSAKELGYACIQKGNWKQAVEALEQAYREDENDVDVLCQLGWAYLNTNLHAKAFHMWNSALKKAPSKRSVVDHIVRGYTVFGKRLKEQRIFNQALVQFKNALKYEPNNIEIRLLLADVYFQMKNYTSAMQEYQKVLDLEPRNKVARQGIRESKRLGGLR